MYIKNKVFFDKLNILLDLQIHDIWKALDKHADMLCIVGCMNMIEFMGGVITGKLGVDLKEERGVVKNRFFAGVELLSDDWKRGIFSKSHIIFSEDDMWDLRNSLTHQYTAKAPKYQSVIVTGTEHKDIVFQYGKTQSSRLVDKRLIVALPVLGLTLEMADARKILISRLENDKTIRDMAKKALSKLPEIVFVNTGRGVSNV